MALILTSWVSAGRKPAGEMQFPAPEGCPCRPQLLCDADQRQVFAPDCNIPLHLVPAFSTRTYSMHGGAGGILSAGLLQAVTLQQMEACIARQGHSTGGAQPQNLPEASRTSRTIQISGFELKMRPVTATHTDDVFFPHCQLASNSHALIARSFLSSAARTEAPCVQEAIRSSPFACGSWVLRTQTLGRGSTTRPCGCLMAAPG